VLQLEEQLAERHVAITLVREARAWLAAKGYDPVYGARPLGRVVQKEVRDPLTDEILFGTLAHGGTVTIGVADGHLTFFYERRMRSGHSTDPVPPEHPAVAERPAAGESDRDLPPTAPTGE
jgi:ATP-dependent Clp protease ATP-binding subunit ClpA